MQQQSSTRADGSVTPPHRDAVSAPATPVAGVSQPATPRDGRRFSFTDNMLQQFTSKMRDVTESEWGMHNYNSSENMPDPLMMTVGGGVFSSLVNAGRLSDLSVGQADGRENLLDAQTRGRHSQSLHARIGPAIRYGQAAQYGIGDVPAPLSRGRSVSH
jgi:hypothetical protein